MATPAHYVKIGLFVVAGLVAAAALAITLGVTRTHKKTTAYYTYFNEPVTGLDVGAPVKARGVNAGVVGEITFAPDHRMVEVRLDMDDAVLSRFGGLQEGHTVRPELRTQLASQGITGARFVAIDFFDPTTNPPLALNFNPPERYIPSAKSLEDSITKAMDGLAKLIDTMSREGFSEKVVQAMTTVNDVLVDVDHLVRGLAGQQLPARAAATLDHLDVAVSRANRVLERVDGDSGLVATAQRSLGAFGEVGRNASSATRDLDRTLGEIREAAAAVRLLADEVEREPDMLLKGRASGGSP